MPSALLYFGTDGVSKGAFRLLLPPVDRCTGVIPSSLPIISSSMIHWLGSNPHAESIPSLRSITWCCVGPSSVSTAHMGFTPRLALHDFLEISFESSRS